MSDTIQTTKKQRVQKKQVDYLTGSELNKLLSCAPLTRWGKRDQCLILLTYRHALRASEAVNLRWDQIDLVGGRIHCIRNKGSIDSVHNLEGDEMRLLRRLRKDWPDSSFVFNSERGGPMTTHAFRAMLKTIEVKANFPFRLHPHMLRHSCGYTAANSGKTTRDIQQYMGHSNIQNTVRYTQLDSKRFRGWGAELGGRV